MNGEIAVGAGIGRADIAQRGAIVDLQLTGCRTACTNTTGDATIRQDAYLHDAFVNNGGAGVGIGAGELKATGVGSISVHGEVVGITAITDDTADGAD